jgi:TctA family transporter
VLGPRFEENFRRAMLIARGDFTVFVTRPISAVFVGLCLLLIGTQLYVRMRGGKGGTGAGAGHTDASPPISPEMAPQRIPVTPAE